MAARNKPYEQFGTFILFKKLESDALGDLWRAGRIAGGQLGPTVALRRMSGGNRETLSANTRAVAQMLPHISGTSFVRDQRAGVVDGIPYLEWEYGGGRSLRHIINRARGGSDNHPNPLPIDQAIVIAEKIALSLSTMADLRDTNGARLSHGALIPQFVWISDDGEIRVAGQQLGTGIIAALADPNVALELGRYFAPEYRAGQPQKASDVYSMGAILFLLVTGQEPPDALNASAFATAVRGARTMMGAPVPDDVRVILDKSLNLDPSMRYPSMAEMKQAISGLMNSGRYSATTFNLAFYLSSLLKKELESEAADRDKEAKLDIAAFLAAPKPAAAPAPVAAAAPAAEATPAPAPAMFATAEPKKKSKAPLAIAAVVVLGIIGAGGYVMFTKSSAQPAPKAVAPAQMIPKPAPRIISEPIAVTATPATTTAPATATTTAAPATDTAAAQQKAFEEAVRLKMHEEMMKLQNDFMTELKQKQARTAPVATAPAPAAPVQTAAAHAEEKPAISAAQLDQQRRDTAPAELPRTATTAPATAPAVAVQQQAPAPAPVQQPAIHEGDVVDVGSLDVIPRPLRAIKPQYPPLAMRQKIAATIIVSVFVTETGEVTDVRVLRGDARFGLNDAAIRAMRSTRFSPPMKDGKRVRTWFPQSIEFKP